MGVNLMGVCGAAAVLLACVGGFGELRQAMLRRVQELDSWLAAVRVLQTEMTFGALPLSRLCGNITAQTEGAAAAFFQELGDRLAAGESLAASWPELLAQNAAGAHLLPGDTLVLRELGAGLGASGLAQQKRLLALTEERLQALRAEASERYRRLARLLSALGWSSGLLLICLAL